MPHIEIGFTFSAFSIILLLIAAIAVSYFVYRYTIPPVSRAKRALLTLLRSTSLFLLLVLLFEPILRLVFSSQQPPGIAILIDDSKSMAITDRTGNRKEDLSRVLSSPELRDIASEAGARSSLFGVSARNLDRLDMDSISLEEDATDIASALQYVSQKKDRQNIQAAILISDGSYNLGQNPLYLAEQLGIPVSTIGIGDSSEQKDVLVSRLATNDVVYNGTSVPVDVSIKSSGYGVERAEVTLSEGQRELDRKTITMSPGTREYLVHLAYSPDGSGLKKYVVRISSLPDELTTKNNQKSFYAKILKTKLRILIIAGGPSPDLSIIGQTLKEDRNLEVHSFAQRMSGGFYEGPLAIKQLDSADCVMLISFPTSTTSIQTLSLITGVITSQRRPLFFLGGKALDYERLSTLSSVLPFTTLRLSPNEEYVFFSPTELQRSNPILTVSTNGDLDPWNKLPPIFKTESIFKEKPEATVLGFSNIRGIATHDPLILTRNVNRQKSLAVLAYGLWRWRLMAQGTPETEKLLSTFLINSVKWLTTSDDSRPVKIVTTKESFTQGESVEFVGQVYNATAEPVENAEVTLNVRQGETQVPSSLRPIGNGRYEGSIDGLTEGDYTFTALARIDGQQIGEDHGRFSVGELNLEFQDTRMSVGLLRQIAYRTGGQYYSANNLTSLVRDITKDGSFTSREVNRVETIELWNWRYMLGLIVLLFGVEWFVRKRTGML
jgi:hypothetical protein